MILMRIMFTWQTPLIYKDSLYSSISEVLFLFNNPCRVHYESVFPLCHCRALINPFLLSEPHSIYFIAVHSSPFWLQYPCGKGQCQIHFLLYCQHQVQYLVHHSESINIYKINECDLNTTHIKPVSV